MMRAATAASGRHTRHVQQRVSPSTKVASAKWQQQHQQYQRTSLSASQLLHTYIGGPLDDRRRQEQDEQQRARLHAMSVNSKYGNNNGMLLSSPQWMQVAHYHSTPRQEKVVAIMLGLGAVSALSYAGASAVRAYNEYKASLPSPEEMEEIRKQEEKEAAEQQQQQEAEAQANAKDSSSKTANGKGDEKRENVFSKWFGVGVGAKYYEGGFEDTMTRREAALILGVRESSPPSRIKEAHRKLLVLNHPDTGGSTYVSGKINEAKELLLKGRRK